MESNKQRTSLYLLACKLFISFVPALVLLLVSYENWTALILSILLCLAAVHEIRREKET